MINFLVEEMGIPVHLQSPETARTPLHYASFITGHQTKPESTEGQMLVIKAFLQLGADRTLKDQNGDTPAELA